MSKTYEKVGKGRFFNETPENEKQPNFKGKAEIAGKEFDLAIWRRTSKAGSRYLSVSFSLPGEREQIGNGALFERDNKNRKAPRLTGPAEIGGRNFEMGVWPQVSEAGNEYFSVKFELVTETEDE